jgi:hypothetical protein
VCQVRFRWLFWPFVITSDSVNLIELMVAMFLNTSLACTALPAELHNVGGQDFLVTRWLCTDAKGASHLWRQWQRECRFEHATVWGRPYFLEDQASQVALYVNRFGEVQGGPGARIQEAYVPLCGS